MGGNALSVQTERLDDAPYHRAQLRVRDRILDAFPDAKYWFVRHVREKKTHGDMDVLVRQDTVDRDALVREFDPAEVHSNGRVDSLDYYTENGRPFQLDLVHMRREWWDAARIFHDWNDLGNLLGKVARFHRYKYGFQGLRIPVYHTMDRSQKLGEYTLSTCPFKILRFLGYDPAPAVYGGFDTFEEMFAYVMTSERATYDVFQPETLTASQRQRDAKRSVYRMFTEWLEEQFNPRCPGKTTARSDRFQRRPSHRAAFDEAVEAFPGADVADRAREDREALRRRDAAACVFNGAHVMGAFNVQGAELGAVLSAMRERHAGAWEEHVLRSGRDALLDEFQEAWTSHRESDS